MTVILRACSLYRILSLMLRSRNCRIRWGFWAEWMSALQTDLVLQRWTACSRNNSGLWLQDSMSPRTGRATWGAGRDIVITEWMQTERGDEVGGQSLCGGQRHSDAGLWVRCGHSLSVSLSYGESCSGCWCLPGCDPPGQWAGGCEWFPQTWVMPKLLLPLAVVAKII